MLSIVFGLISVSLGFWGLVEYWPYLVDVLIAFLPLLLMVGGGIALLAGVRNTGMQAAFMKKSAAAPKETLRNKDL